MAFIGQSIRRLEDIKFLTGRGRYVSDIDMPGAWHMAVVRSPHAHARVLRIQGGDGFLLTGADLALHGVGELPCTSQIGVPIAMAGRPVLAGDRVRHVGQAVAFVCAATADAARDAAEAVQVEYEALPANVDPHAAFTAPELHPHAPHNLVFDWQKGDAAATEAAFASAACVTRLAIANPRITCAPVEPRAAIATPAGQLICNGQAVHAMRRQIADCMGVAEASLHLVVPDVRRRLRGEERALRRACRAVAGSTAAGPAGALGGRAGG